METALHSLIHRFAIISHTRSCSESFTSRHLDHFLNLSLPVIDYSYLSSLIFLDNHKSSSTITISSYSPFLLFSTTFSFYTLHAPILYPPSSLCLLISFTSTIPPHLPPSSHLPPRPASHFPSLPPLHYLTLLLP